MTDTQFESWMGELGRRGAPHSLIHALRALRGAIERQTTEQLAVFLRAWERRDYRGAVGLCYPLLNHDERARFQAMGQQKALEAAEAAWRAQGTEQKLALAVLSALVSALV